jgi:outer membrane usher protein
MVVTLRGRQVPFGARASVANGETLSHGIVDDKQHVYLSGVPAAGVVKVNWKGGECQAPFTLGKAQFGVNSVTAQCR